MSVRRSGTSASLCQVRHAVALIPPRGVGDARAAPGRGKRQIRGEKGSLPQGREREGGPFPFGNGRGKQAPRRGEWRERGVRFTVEWVAGKRDPFVRGSREEGVPMPGPWGDGKETPSARGWSGSGGGGIPDVDEDGDSNPLLSESSPRGGRFPIHLRAIRTCPMGRFLEEGGIPIDKTRTRDPLTIRNAAFDPSPSPMVGRITGKGTPLHSKDLTREAICP